MFVTHIFKQGGLFLQRTASMTKFNSKTQKFERPKSLSMMSIFQTAIAYLEESDNETITLYNLHNMMELKSGLSEDQIIFQLR